MTLRRRELLVSFSALGLVACAPSAPPTTGAQAVPAPLTTGGAPRPSDAGASSAASASLELAFDNLSFFHRDGERIAIARDGRVVYERMQRGPLMRHELSLAGDPHLREVQRVAARLRVEKTALPSRTGVPDEVTMRFHVAASDGTLVTASLWEADSGKLAPNDVLADALRVVRQAAQIAQTRTTPREVPSEPSGGRWPDVFAPPR